MSVLLSLSSNDIIETQKIVSKTYKIDFENKRISGYIDELDAVSQYVQKALRTSRLKHFIYSDQYGNDLIAAFRNEKMSDLYIEEELPRLIEDALLCDERITGVDNISFDSSGDSIFYEFNLHSIYGQLTMTGEIT